MINATINSNKLSLFIPCMYLTKLVFGRSGSGFLMYKYSAICFNTPIKKLYRKDTVLQNLTGLIKERDCDVIYPASS